MKRKNEVGDHCIAFAAMLKTQTGKDVKILRTDQGTEYAGEKFNQWVTQSGIIHQTTVRYTPQQNGISERANRTLMDGVRSIMYTNDSNNQLIHNTRKSLMELWGEFLLATVYIRNRTVTAQTDSTPFEKFFNKKPSVAHLRILGCRPSFTFLTRCVTIWILKQKLAGSLGIVKTRKGGGCGPDNEESYCFS
jgi:hypothetical protein